jgi:ATP-dependent 26S proteasome regulatory subunit
MALSPEDFGASFQDFMKQMVQQAPAEGPVFLRRLRAHFEQEPATLPVVSETFAEHEHPNVQTALDAWLAEPGRSADVVGIVDEHAWLGVSLARLVAPKAAAMMGGGEPSEGPVQYVNLSLDEDRILTCVQRGLYFVRAGEERLAVLLQGPMRERHFTKATVEVMAGRRESAEKFLAELRNMIRQRNVYRGHVLSLGQDQMMLNLQITFHQLPTIERTGIILPEGLLERIERLTVRFAEHSQKLKAAGRHLKRGILLHGAPGTGKTMTAMYLARAIRDQTVLLLTGSGLGLIEQSCAMARALQPALVILEDVDLVAEERTGRGPGCASPLLFELLNEMDGLADDADVLFLLTSNRPDLLEPALAARPGRIDQAIEIPLPDAACRRRLFDLYGKGLSLQVADWDQWVQRTKGASPAFIRELLRKAALFAADETGTVSVTDRHLDQAIHELVVQGGELTKSLLGFQTPDRDRRS